MVRRSIAPADRQPPTQMDGSAQSSAVATASSMSAGAMASIARLTSSGRRYRSAKNCVMDRAPQRRSNGGATMAPDNGTKPWSRNAATAGSKFASSHAVVSASSSTSRTRARRDSSNAGQPSARMTS